MSGWTDSPGISRSTVVSSLVCMTASQKRTQSCASMLRAASSLGLTLVSLSSSLMVRTTGQARQQAKCVQLWRTAQCPSCAPSSSLLGCAPPPMSSKLFLLVARSSEPRLIKVCSKLSANLQHCSPVWRSCCHIRICVFACITCLVTAKCT